MTVLTFIFQKIKMNGSMAHEAQEKSFRIADGMLCRFDSSGLHPIIGRGKSGHSKYSSRNSRLFKTPNAYQLLPERGTKPRIY